MPRMDAAYCGGQHAGGAGHYSDHLGKRTGFGRG